MATNSIKTNKNRGKRQKRQKFARLPLGSGGIEGERIFGPWKWGLGGAAVAVFDRAHLPVEEFQIFPQDFAFVVEGVEHALVCFLRICDGQTVQWCFEKFRRLFRSGTVQPASPVLVCVVVFDTYDLHCARAVQRLKHFLLVETGVHVARMGFVVLFDLVHAHEHVLKLALLHARHFEIFKVRFLKGRGNAWRSSKVHDARWTLQAPR